MTKAKFEPIENLKKRIELQATQIELMSEASAAIKESDRIVAMLEKGEQLFGGNMLFKGAGLGPEEIMDSVLVKTISMSSAQLGRKAGNLGAFATINILKAEAL